MSDALIDAGLALGFGLVGMGIALLILTEVLRRAATAGRRRVDRRWGGDTDALVRALVRRKP